MSASQLDDTELTLSDMKAIKKSFFETIKRSYHPRVKYPDQRKDDKSKKEEGFDETKEETDTVEDKASLEQTEKENSPEEESSFPQETTEIDLREGY